MRRDTRPTRAARPASELVQRMEKNRLALNRILPPYSSIAKIDVYSEEFQKTPTKKIKRFLYSGAA